MSLLRLKTSFLSGSRRGFTLIELLVVISMIVVLVMITSLIYSSLFEQGRDAQRKGDLTSIQHALEQYYVDQGFYPMEGDVTFGSSLAVGSKTYHTALPKDPTGAFPYLYKPTKTDGGTCDNTDTTKLCVKYCLYGAMEVDDNNNSAAVSCADDADRKYEVQSP